MLRRRRTESFPVVPKTFATAVVAVKAAGPDRITARALRESGHRWMPTFRGSDHLVLIRPSPRAS